MALIVVLEAVVLVGEGVKAGRQEDNLRREDGELALLALGKPRLGGGPSNAISTQTIPAGPAQRNGDPYRPGKPTMPTTSPLLRCSCCASNGTAPLASCAWHMTWTLTPSFLTS